MSSYQRLSAQVSCVLLRRVDEGFSTTGKPVVDRSPVPGRHVRAVDWLCPDRIDQLQRYRYFLRSPHMQQNRCPRCDADDALKGLPRRPRLQDHEFPARRAVCVRLPLDATENGSRFEKGPATKRINPLNAVRSAKAQVDVHSVLNVDQAYAGQRRNHTSFSVSGKRSSRRPRTSSATATPVRKAATLMRPRSAGVTADRVIAMQYVGTRTRLMPLSRQMRVETL